MPSLTTIRNIIAVFYCLYLCRQILYLMRGKIYDAPLVDAITYIAVDISANICGMAVLLNILATVDETSIESYGFLIMSTMALGLIYGIGIFVISPYRRLFDAYCNVKSHGPCIPYSVFKSMYTIHPDYFLLGENEFRYHDEAFHLNIVDYIRALYLIKDKTKPQPESANKIYTLMQHDLQKDRARLRAENEATLQRMQDMINHNQN